MRERGNSIDRSTTGHGDVDVFTPPRQPLGPLEGGVAAFSRGRSLPDHEGGVPAPPRRASIMGTSPSASTNSKTSS